MLHRICLRRRKTLKVEYLGENTSMFVTALDHKSDLVGSFDEKKRGQKSHAAVTLSFDTQIISSPPHAYNHGFKQ